MAQWKYLAALRGNRGLRSSDDGQLWAIPSSSPVGNCGQERRGVPQIVSGRRADLCDCGHGMSQCTAVAVGAAGIGAAVERIHHRPGRPVEHIRVAQSRAKRQCARAPRRPVVAPPGRGRCRHWQDTERLARELEQRLSKDVKEPVVTVIATGFIGPFNEQVRVIGEAAQPRAIPFRTDMTVLDAMIAVGGLTLYAAGDNSVIVRNRRRQAGDLCRASRQPDPGWRRNEQCRAPAGRYPNHSAAPVLSVWLEMRRTMPFSCSRPDLRTSRHSFALRR